ncbi:hypothetical protein ABIC22_000894 [Paenibacillus sp. PvP094]
MINESIITSKIRVIIYFFALFRLNGQIIMEVELKCLNLYLNFLC